MLLKFVGGYTVGRWTWSLPVSCCLSFSPWNLGQSWISMTVLESACPEDSETPPDCWIWWRFGWDIEGWTQPLFQLLLLFLGLENFAMDWLKLDLQYLSQIFIKFNNQGVFRNPQDMQIPKLSLKFKIVQDFMEKKTKIFATGKRAKTVFNLSPCPLKTATNSV